MLPVLGLCWLFPRLIHTDPAFSFTDTVDQQIDGEQRSAQEVIAQNLRVLVARQPQIRLVDDPWAVFGDRYGIATDSTARKALRALEKSGELVVAGKAKQLRDFIVAAPGPLTP